MSSVSSVSSVSSMSLIFPQQSSKFMLIIHILQQDVTICYVITVTQCYNDVNTYLEVQNCVINPRKDGRAAKGQTPKGLQSAKGRHGSVHFPRGSFLLRKRKTISRSSNAAVAVAILQRLYRLPNHRRRVSAKIKSLLQSLDAAGFS